MAHKIMDIWRIGDTDTVDNGPTFVENLTVHFVNTTFAVSSVVCVSTVLGSLPFWD